MNLGRNLEIRNPKFEIRNKFKMGKGENPKRERLEGPHVQICTQRQNPDHGPEWGVKDGGSVHGEEKPPANGRVSWP